MRSGRVLSWVAECFRYFGKVVVLFVMSIIVVAKAWSCVCQLFCDLFFFMAAKCASFNLIQIAVAIS